MRSQTVTTVLDADQQAVFDDLSDIERLPRSEGPAWRGFCR